MQELADRVVKIEAQIESQDKRLDRHSQYIRDMQLQNERQDAKLTEICKKTSENTEISRGIKGGIKTIQWLFYGATALLGLYLTLKQLGWM